MSLFAVTRQPYRFPLLPASPPTFIYSPRSFPFRSDLTPLT
jgi:hypothetical protein